MIEVISIKFKNRGKCYFFSPNGLEIKSGSKVIVETSKGLEIADCHYGNHMVEETSVVQPLRPVVRIASEDDLRVAELNKRREKEAFEICQKKIAEHGLDMKLVDVECNFEGNKTMFFFTSDGRVDFRELVKDLAGIFRNRIELRQIGVRDEAKMIGGIGICGRPYCCHQFLDEFQPVSTKMAKVQNLSLNPTKISGSCGRLMCCLRYEQEAYEDLLKKVPKQGAFVETKDGYGNAVQVNLLRQTVKVKLDEGGDDNVRLFKANELCTVPGGRPKDGEEPPHVLRYVPEPEEEEPEEENEWFIPEAVISEPVVVNPERSEKKRSGANKGRRGKGRPQKGRSEGEKPQMKNDKAEQKKNEGKKPQVKKNDNKKREGGEKPVNGQKKRPNKPNSQKNGPKPSGQKTKNQGPKPQRAESGAKEGSENKKPYSPRKKNGKKPYYKAKPKNGSPKPAGEAKPKQ